MEKDKSIIDTIYAEYNSFFEAEKKIADYILKDGVKLIEMTISELAKSSHSANISWSWVKCSGVKI